MLNIKITEINVALEVKLSFQKNNVNNNAIA